jgi:hypothetical protein
MTISDFGYMIFGFPESSSFDIQHSMFVIKKLLVIELEEVRCWMTDVR